MVRVAINGFGRIGRNVFRAGADDEGMEFVALNDLMDPKTLGHLLKYDSVHGRFKGEVRERDGNLEVNGKILEVHSQRDPGELPWGDLGIDVVGNRLDFSPTETARKSTLMRGLGKWLSQPQRRSRISP